MSRYGTLRRRAGPNPVVKLLGEMLAEIFHEPRYRRQS